MCNRMPCGKSIGGGGVSSMVCAPCGEETMETIEEIDPWSSSSLGPGGNVSLKEAISLQQLPHGVLLEIDPDSTHSYLGEEEEGDKESYQQDHMLDQLNPECINVAAANNSETEQLSPFERMACDMSPVPGTNGNVLKKVLTQGVGEVVPEGATVRVHYNGYMEYSDEPYDSSRLRGKVQKFRLGHSEVIEGWDCGVATMKRSEVARFLVNPSYAFGDHGCPPRIPPGATIMFEIELISFMDLKAADDFSSLTAKEKREATLKQLIAAASAEKAAGNSFFEHRMYGKASSKYLKAVRLLEPARLKDEAEEEQWKEVLLKLYLNQSLTSLKMKKYRLAVAQCRRALDIQPKNVKAHFRLGQAFMHLSEFNLSKDHLLKACRLSPSNQEIRLELQKLDKAVAKFRALEKSMYSKMVGFVAPSATSGEQEDKDQREVQQDVMEEIRRQFVKELTLMKDRPSMKQIVLPHTLTSEQEDTARQVAEELGLFTEKVPGSGLQIFKQVEEEVKVDY